MCVLDYPESLMKFVFLYFVWFIVYIKASRHEEAEQLFRQAQLIAPTDPAVYMQSGTYIYIYM